MKFQKKKLKILVLSSLLSNVSYSDEIDITYCDTTQEIQQCIDSSKSGHIVLSAGLHLTDGILLGSNTKLVIPKGAILKLSDDAILNPKAFGGTANYVIASIGDPDNYITNIEIIINGEVDGNRDKHPYEKGGVEGIDLKYVENSIISGNGVVHSANGDGVDLDAVRNIKVENITVRDNNDSGIHFGSPRPIIGSHGNLVYNVTSINNGYRIGKSGFDLSWPNPHGVTYVNCKAIDNYRNYKIEGVGGVIYNSKSLELDRKVIEKDDFSGASYVYMNGEDMTNQSFISQRKMILLKRDIKKLLGMEYQKHLDGVEY
ncbi:right-handed parallel beta-helix repeat-containing protein [Vibrio sp. ER1A]|uniref:right-handed parallel beta-helix repeat-containing protein n=1 Tax=Vibrio sp. ER1A TaxID=1517681 RepID=UPI0004DD15A5|nr:right-handed parallel beta-helix repeat-containing protein [Vibrio sp. ER1A]KFA99243.1 hypothetical protein HW45_05000 [Vibrio sp. ER1A]